MCGSAAPSQNNTTIFPVSAFQSEFLEQSTLHDSCQGSGELTVSNSCASMPQDYDVRNNLSNYTPSLVNTGNVVFHDSTQTSDLNFTTPNQFYTVNGKLQDSYNEVQQMDFGTNSMDMHAQACSFDGALQTYIPNPQVNNNSQLPGMYESMDCNYRSVAVNNGGGDNHSTYNLNPGTYHDSSTGHFPSQYCVVPDNQFIMSSNELHLNASVDQKPFQQFTGVPLSNSNSMEEDQLTRDGVAMNIISVDVGIQCEVGPETLLALHEEEEEGEMVEGFDVGDTNDESQTDEGMLCLWILAIFIQKIDLVVEF